MRLLLNWIRTSSFPRRWELVIAVYISRCYLSAFLLRLGVRQGMITRNRFEFSHTITHLSLKSKSLTGESATIWGWGKVSSWIEWFWIMLAGRCSLVGNWWWVVVGAPPEWIDHGMSLVEKAEDRKCYQKDEESEGSSEFWLSSYSVSISSYFWCKRRSYDRRKQGSSWGRGGKRKSQVFLFSDQTDLQCRVQEEVCKENESITRTYLWL